ncbi:DUF669 domain-containing protein [Endozoicomonas sp. SM1973]|uniref:DUF669 domain-containing protein n=1 Tax=Spartinivicinus marinus TaxID=2994442 RepID=A0A853IJ11_9GAMM|nr:DUF669 domain-containing protein [Spartinivicinus marinus]MCX4027880.1 DUF669 domain-containing protein [Spartinivicinus marinus]NYZ70014.1 DUF669 domain-containing protein [Spartinivicinus marinus]
MASFGFNTGEYDPNAGFEVLPAGDYIAMLVEADIKTNSKNTGQFINCKWLITEGEFANRNIFDAVNITHQNTMAEKLGRQRLSAIAHAIGIPDAQDTDQLLQKPCVLTLGIKKDKEYGDKNIIKHFAAYQFGMQQPASPGSYQQTAVPTMPPQGMQQQPPAQPQINQAPIQQPAAQPQQQPMNIGGPNGQPVFNTPSSEQAAKIAV